MINENESGLPARLAKLSPQQRRQLQIRIAAQRSTGIEAAAEALRSCAVTHLFGVAGEPSESILPACQKVGIRPIGVHNQSAAVCMALAQNFQAGKLVAVALVSAGPAVTNALTGILVAYDNGWPVIVLGGRRSSFQAFDARPVLAPMVKQAWLVSSASEITDSIRAAYREALSGRPGPVYLDLHENALFGTTQRAKVLSAPQPALPPCLDDATVNRVATALTGAQRPAMILGKGARWTVNAGALQGVVEKLGLAFITSPMGRGFGR